AGGPWVARRHVQLPTSRLGGLQGLTQPDLLGEPAQAVLALIEPTGAQVFDAFLGARLDVAAVDPDGWRGEGAGLCGDLLVGDVEDLDLSVAAKLCADSLDQRDRAGAVGQPGKANTTTSGRWKAAGREAGLEGGRSGLPGCGSRWPRGRRCRLPKGGVDREHRCHPGQPQHPLHTWSGPDT